MGGKLYSRADTFINESPSRINPKLKSFSFINKLASSVYKNMKRPHELWISLGFSQKYIENVCDYLRYDGC